MSIVKKFLLGLLVFVAALVVIGLFLPSTAHVERTATIEAPPHVVFALVNGFRTFTEWSPWAERDPETVYTFEGPDVGVGAKMAWSSNNSQVGSGYQLITASEPHGLVRTHLDLGSQGTAEVFFLLEDLESGGTSIRWGFDTDFGLNLVSRYMGLMFDRWIGADYEAGLLNLRMLAESLPSADWTDLEIEVAELEPVGIASVSGTSIWEAAAIGQALTEAYGGIGRFMGNHKLERAGQPVAITTSQSPEEWQFEAGIPIVSAPDLEIDPDSPVQIREIDGGTVIRGISVGPYTNIPANWRKMIAFAAANGYIQRGDPWEQFLSDPASTPEDDLITHLYLPVR